MSDQNSAAAVASESDPQRILAENASLRQRLAALESQNVISGRFKGEEPQYRLNDRCYLDDTLFEPGTVIQYTDYPNLSMVPLNDPARRMMESVIQNQIDGAKIVASRHGREFFGLVNDRNIMLDLLREDTQRGAIAEVPQPIVKMPEVRGDVPSMPHLGTEADRRRPGRPRKVTQIGQDAAPSNARHDLGAPILEPYAPNIGPAVVGRMVG